MKQVFIYCEGQTEEGFINNVLSPYFAQMEIYVTPIIHKTKRTPTGAYKGGVSRYEAIRRELEILCQTPNVLVTTMFDNYQMQTGTTAIDSNQPAIYKRL